jgi:hypothetical protein
MYAYAEAHTHYSTHIVSQTLHLKDTVAYTHQTAAFSSNRNFDRFVTCKGWKVQKKKRKVVATTTREKHRRKFKG